MIFIFIYTERKLFTAMGILKEYAESKMFTCINAE